MSVAVECQQRASTPYRSVSNTHRAASSVDPLPTTSRLVILVLRPPPGSDEAPNARNGVCARITCDCDKESNEREKEQT